MTDNFKDLIDSDDFLLTECRYLDIEDDININMDTSFVVAHFNVHSLPSKFDDLVELMDVFREKNFMPSILLLCETFLSEKNHSRYALPNFDMVSEYRKNKQRGGVSILIRNGINFIERPDLRIFEEGKFESIFIEIPSKNMQNVVIGEIYRTPGTNERDFIDNYDTIVKKIKLEHKNIIIGTDQNLDLLKINTHTNTQDFFELNLTNGLLPTIYKPTRITHSSATLIDNIYVDNSLHNDSKSYILKGDISDHCMCITVLSHKINTNEEIKYIKRRTIDDDVLRKMNASLKNRNWNILEYLNIHESSELLIQEITTVMDFYAPEKTKIVARVKRIKQPWYTQGMKKSARRCLILYNKVINKPKDSIEYQNYKKYRNEFNKIRRKAKFSYYHELIKENRNNSKKTWDILNRLIGKLKNKKEVSDEMIINGIKESNTIKICNGFAKYYSEIGQKLANSIKDKGNIKDPMSYLNNRINHNCFLYPTTVGEIEKLIIKLKTKDSSGLDEISNRTLKKIYPGIIQALKIIFNKSMQEGTFPNNMKSAIVIPIYKNKKKSEIPNYRPVSLLPTISKILEKIIYNRIVNFFKKYKIFYEGQYGFRQNRSTIDAILDLTGNIINNNNIGNYTLALFLDLSKAFDSLDHKTIIKKLDYYGIRGIALSWFKSYLQEREIKVKIKMEISDSYKNNFGTPQGSVLGPLIFIILANDLVKSLKFCNAVTFADDTTIFASGKKLKFLYKKVNTDLVRLNDWMRSNSLTINADKTKYVLFHSKQKKIDYNEDLHVDQTAIDRVKCIKFLGVMIDEHLEWDHQVKQVINKMIMGNYSIKMVKNMLSVQSKLLVYHANVMSHATYGISAWGPLISDKLLKKLKVQQNNSLRLIFNIHKRGRVTELYKNAKTLKIDDTIKLELIKISHRHIYDQLPTRIRNLFEIQNHEHYTRNRNNLITPHHTTVQYNKCFLGKSPHLWLQLPDNIKDLHKIKNFAKRYSQLSYQAY